VTVAAFVTRNGEWEPGLISSDRCFGFPDERTQGILLPYYTDGWASVDPYDGGDFKGEALDKLAENIRRGIVEVSAREENQDGVSRQQLLELLNTTLTLIAKASADGESLAFIGD